MWRRCDPSWGGGVDVAAASLKEVHDYLSRRDEPARVVDFVNTTDPPEQGGTDVGHEEHTQGVVRCSAQLLGLADQKFEKWVVLKRVRFRRH